MHPRISELLAYTDEQRARLRSTAQNVPAAHHATSPGPGQWSVLEILDHLRIVEGRIAGLIASKVAEARAQNVAEETDASPILPGFSIDRVLDRGTRLRAPTPLTPTAPTNLDEALAALDATRAKFRDAVLAGDGLALGTLSYPHLYFGDLNLYEWIAFTGAHEARHADQIREVGASLSGAV